MALPKNNYSFLPLVDIGLSLAGGYFVYITNYTMGKVILYLLASGLMGTIGSNYFSNNNTKHMKLNAGIITSKLDETKKFYQDVLGFGVRFESSWYILMHTPDGSDEISFLEPGHSSQAPVFQPAFNGKGIFLTLEVDDVDAEYKRIKALKVPIVVELKSEGWGDRHFAIVDPNVVGVDIVTHTSPGS